MPTPRVWIVLAEELEAPNDVLAVLGSAEEAAAFAERVAPGFEDGVLVVEYDVGWRYDGGAARGAAR